LRVRVRSAFCHNRRPELALEALFDIYRLISLIQEGLSIAKESVRGFGLMGSLTVTRVKGATALARDLAIIRVVTTVDQRCVLDTCVVCRSHQCSSTSRMACTGSIQAWLYATACDVSVLTQGHSLSRVVAPCSCSLLLSTHVSGRWSSTASWRNAKLGALDPFETVLKTLFFW